MASLEGLIGRLNRGKVAGELWIDGSFLTEEVDPRDVDLSLHVMGEFYDAASVTKQRLMDSVELLYDTDKIDGYIVPQWARNSLNYREGLRNRDVWQKQWGKARSGIPKGIAVIELTLRLQ